MELNCPSNTNECIDLIEHVLRKNPTDRLYLLIHNLDGIMLRSNKAQDVLSCLTSIPNLCVLASIDHINAPLCMFNFAIIPYYISNNYHVPLRLQYGITKNDQNLISFGGIQQHFCLIKKKRLTKARFW